jgi:hypothetical protein
MDVLHETAISVPFATLRPTHSLLVKPRFGVVVHHVLTEGLNLEQDKERAIQKIIEENDLQERGFRIEDIT